MRFAALACAALLATQALHAQTWPSRPMTILVTTTPGTGIDLLDKQGLVPVGGPASRLADMIRLELERWPRVVASAGIKAD